MHQDVVLEPLPGVEVVFDNAALPWHTSCAVSAPNGPGTMATVAAAFAAARVVVHSGRIATVGGVVIDRFTVTDRHGRKLDDAAMARVEDALAGIAPTRRFSRRRRDRRRPGSRTGDSRRR